MPVPTLIPATWLPDPPAYQLVLPAQALVSARYHYGKRLRDLEHSTMGGPTGNPAFGQVVAASEVYWRFTHATGRGTYLSEDAPLVWRDTALAGSLIALNRLVDETVERAPQIAAVRGAIGMLVNPNIAVKTGPRGPRVSHQVGPPQQRRLDDEAQSLGFVDRQPAPSFGVGLDWSLREADDDPEDPLLRGGAWLAVNNLGITSARAEADALNQAWSLTARQKVAQRLFLFGTTRSEPDAIAPASWGAGLIWTVPRTTGWTVKLERKTRYDQSEPPMWTLSVRGEQRSRTIRETYRDAAP